MKSIGDSRRGESQPMEKPFENLTTEQFRIKMRPHAIAIYQRLWPGCKVEDLREKGVKVHILDQYFGIDTLATFKSGQWISIQEKYRDHSFLVEQKFQVKPGTPDFTQEHMNGYGTPYQSNGEWFKLGAQLYFYGWSNEQKTAFEKWVLLDVAKYKLLVEAAGGLEKVGRWKRNRKHGAASFYAIPVTSLKDAWVCTHLDHSQAVAAIKAARG